MPELSRFYGIIIAMYYDEHNPPHFHAKYNEHKVAIKIDDLAIIEGSLPSKALGLVIEWASMHMDDLNLNWNNARSGDVLFKINPL